MYWHPNLVKWFIGSVLGGDQIFMQWSNVVITPELSLPSPTPDQLISKKKNVIFGQEKILVEQKPETGIHVIVRKVVVCQNWHLFHVFFLIFLLIV